MSSTAVILADGSFPVHHIPLSYLRDAEHIICCDGSTGSLILADLEPEAIVGDLDSLDTGIAERFADRLYKDSEQDTNDLTKAVKWCINKRYKEIVILGATGKREDHTVGNISLLAEYAREINVIMVTDTGTFTPLLKNSVIKCFPGQQVSIFSINPETEVTSKGLKYQLDKLKLQNWWRATLNEAEADSFELSFRGGPLIVYQKFRD
ncbi:MAG: thiamine diphosphokinase [Bacteroidia bacterium]|jgi:thiamine pyrophosphokinase|nr:thiamine diphosphokinase [Bacteroidia bacterium]